MHSLRFLLITFLVAGCGAGRTLVLEPPKATHYFETLRLRHDHSTAQVPAEVLTKFERRVLERTAEAGLVDGPGLTIAYRFVQFDEGSQLSRWFWGGIGNAGEGSLTVEVRYLDGADNQLAKIQAEGRIGSGFLGGSFDNALEKAADEVVDYTLTNFHAKGSSP